MKIVQLRAENVKRLIAVEITPEGNVIEITGKNGAGKTSVLDSIWWALAGNRTHQAVPVRQGETEAVISLDLGDIKVRREFSVRKPKDGEEPGPVRDRDPAVRGERRGCPLPVARRRCSTGWWTP